jgi:predicted DNA-binding transcriptional regulator YafY
MRAADAARPRPDAARPRPDAAPPGTPAPLAATTPAAPPPADLPAAPADQVSALLLAAIGSGGSVWLGYADPMGVTTRRVEPLRLAGGYLTAFDQRARAIRSFSLARITGVAPS